MTVNILDTIPHNGRVVYYPSSCRYSEEFQDLSCEAVILNSSAFRKNERIGKVYCLKFDNNELLGVLLTKGIRLSGIVIIRDGCTEGGNYECVARASFFGRTMPIMADQFDYFCDHGEIPLDVPAQFTEFETPDYIMPFKRHSFPLGRIRSFHVTINSVVDKDFRLGRVRVKIIRDSIWKGLDQSEMVVIKAGGWSARIAVGKYLEGLDPDREATGKYEIDAKHRMTFIEKLLQGGLDPDREATGKYEIVTKSRMRSIEKLLQKANSNKTKRLSLMPIADGLYRKIADEIGKWGQDFPKEVFFYHLNESDYLDLRSMQGESVEE